VVSGKKLEALSDSGSVQWRMNLLHTSWAFGMHQSIVMRLLGAVTGGMCVCPGEGGPARQCCRPLIVWRVADSVWQCCRQMLARVLDERFIGGDA
jgi:hypothetical protein